jgi:hypothetical protein
MIKKLIVSTLMLPIAGFAAASTPLTYFKPVKLTGTMDIVRSIHPNPIYKGERQPAIRLDKPISVMDDDLTDDIDDSEKNVKLIQLYSAEERTDRLYAKLLASKGKHVTINCSQLRHATNGHHTTAVLCTIDSARFGK